jgi:hypothetical protein
VCDPDNEAADWAHTRIDLETLVADGKGYLSPGACYLSQREYLDELEITRVWSALMRKLTYDPPKGVTPDRVRELAKEFGIEVK